MGKTTKQVMEIVGEVPAPARVAKDRFAILPIDSIEPSKTNPRKVFHEKPLGELSESIRTHGVLEPLIVRKFANGAEDSDEPFAYSLVAGERRFRAASRAGLKEVPCIVKDLTDQQTFEIQIDENWQRNDLEPMDEARAIKFIQKSGKLSLEELAARLNKDIRFIHARLKLNDLLPELQKAMDEGVLPVSHGMLIARYPEDKQKVILKECFYGGLGEHSAAITVRELQDRIGRYVEMQLQKAKFDLTDTRLRKDGLACGDCKLRVGANPTLFEEVKPNEDRCLDRKCFENKTLAFVHIIRDELTAKGKKKHGPDYKAALVAGYYESTEFKDALKDSQYKSLRYEKKCKSNETAVDVSTYSVGELVQICRDRKCPVHYGSSSSSRMAGDSEEFNRRKEEIFDTKVREPVRRKVLIAAAPKFAESFTQSCDQPDFFLDLVARALATMGMDNDISHRLVRPFIETLKIKLPDNFYSDSRRDWVKANLSELQGAALLFLLVNGPKGYMFEGGSYRSQGGIMAIAERYGINYRLYDAEQRLVVCKNKKQRVGLEAYLAAVKADPTGLEPMPRFWKSDYLAPDTVEAADDDEEEVI